MCIRDRATPAENAESKEPAEQSEAAPAENAESKEAPAESNASEDNHENENNNQN